MATVKMYVTWPVDSFASGVVGVPTITRAGVLVASTKVTAVRTAAQSRGITVETGTPPVATPQTSTDAVTAGEVATDVATSIRKAVATPHPGAAATAYGTAATVVPDTGFAAMDLLDAYWTNGGLSTETVTLRLTATYTDTTTATVVLPGSLGNAAAATIAATALLALEKDGHSITKLAVAAKSSVAASTAAPAFNVELLQRH